MATPWQKYRFSYCRGGVYGLFILPIYQHQLITVHWSLNTMAHIRPIYTPDIPMPMYLEWIDRLYVKLIRKLAPDQSETLSPSNFQCRPPEIRYEQTRMKWTLLIKNNCWSQSTQPTNAICNKKLRETHSWTIAILVQCTIMWACSKTIAYIGHI